MLSKSLKVILVVYFLLNFTHGQSDKMFFREDYSYIESTEGFYKIHTSKQTWADAKRMCALEGASFFYPDDRNEANAVISFWKINQPNIPWAFVGMSDIMSEGVFETVDGKPVSEVYNQWQRNEPNNFGGNEDCVHLNLQGDINDFPCDGKSYFICKKSLQSLEWNYNGNVPYSDGQKDTIFFRKDYTYIESTEGFYKIHSSRQTWADAKRMCALEGASFFYPDDRNEANAVISFWKSDQPNIPWAFVGMSDIKSEGVFETVDGKPVSEVYNQWQRGEPNNFEGNEDCVHLNLQGDLNDFPCDGKSYFICKKSLKSLEWNHNCNVPYSGYTFYADIEKCYKLHITPLNWDEAYTVCRAERSYLAVITNRLEADYLARLAASSQSVGGSYFRGIFHVGFHNKLHEGWQTVRGTPITVDTDAWWDNYLPDAGDSDRRCGSMFYTGRLNNIDCDTKSFFICELEVKDRNSTLNETVN